MSYKFDMRLISTPLLIVLLRKEIRFPTLFMLKCYLTVGRFKKRIDPRFPKEFIDFVALPIWVYLNLKAKVGQHKALEIMRIPLLTGGVAQQNFTFDTVHTERTFDNLIKKELEMMRTGMTRWNAFEVVERTNHRFEMKITRCLFYQVAASLGVPELLPLACQVDNAANNSYLPDQVTFNRGGPNHRIADGAKVCHFIWEKVD